MPIETIPQPQKKSNLRKPGSQKITGKHVQFELLHRCAIGSQGQRRTRQNRFEPALAICRRVLRNREKAAEGHGFQWIFWKRRGMLRCLKEGT